MKKLFFIGLSLLIAFAFVSPAYANGLETQRKIPVRGSIQPVDGLVVELDDYTENFLKIYTTSGIMDEISTDETENMILLNNDDMYLKNKYGVNDRFVEDLKNVISDANAKGITKGISSDVVLAPQHFNKLPGDNIVTPQVSVKNWKVYFTNAEVRMYFAAAAAAGPATLGAALNSVAFLLGGPVGSTISLVLTIIGTTTLINLSYLILQAEIRKQGIYIGINWNGPFPNYTQGTW